MDTGPSLGSLTINPDGTFSYPHDDSENFLDGFIIESKMPPETSRTSPLTSRLLHQ